VIKNILISNDDGIQSRGIWTLKEYLEADYHVFMVAPDRERSATGHSISLHDPIRLNVIEEGKVYAVNGTPVDAVHLALLGIIKQKIDIVVTGINNGLNLGTDVFYSGTVSAAFQATTHNIPGIAVSIDNSGEMVHYETAAHFAKKLLGRIAGYSLDRNIILSLNVPNIKIQDIRGVEITRLGRRNYDDALVEREDPKKNKYYWIEGSLVHEKDEPGTDVRAVHDNMVSITPLRMDITAVDVMEKLKAWNVTAIMK